ncbi:MAG: aminotransferase class V-fold PLP-dependent enzyme [Thermoanaerobaculales bacterium]|nr:aminotransferase class V-fold PLP-dependent enzyme [Thermoanaerobaculales bacterium]
MTFDIGPWLPDFPIRERCLYLDHAAVCPLPRPVADAMRRRIEDQELGGHTLEKNWVNSTLSCRHVGAELIGCAPEDISLIRSTSEGLSLIAEGLTWKEGDEVLLGEEEFAANAAPWLNLKNRGVKIVRFSQPSGRTDPARIEDLITSRTRLLALSWVAFHTGWVAPLEELGTLCRSKGIFLVVDAIQGLGVLPMKMRKFGLDAVVADSHKWLLGPEGAGLMGTSPALRAQLRPVLSGWRNIKRIPGDFFLKEAEFHLDGRRFEPGATNAVGIAGLAAALDLLTTVGPEALENRTIMLNKHLTRILISRGWEVLSPGSGHSVAGIVAARPGGVDPSEARRRLEERHVVCSVRQALVRFSPHFYVTTPELDALGHILTKCGM